jgi:hypothetical protein
LKLIFKILLLLSPAGLFSQDLSGLREKSVTAVSDTIRLDSLMIVPGSVVLKTNNKGTVIGEHLYRADPLNSLLLLEKDFPFYGEELHIAYRVFTSGPDLHRSRKDSSMIIPFGREQGRDDPYRYTYQPVSNQLWREETLNSSGSISRGLTFGNNQDVIVNSNLNLQLSGKLDDNLNITASISDQNIPLQPEGYSQQIHEFDKIFIHVYNDKTGITAGDFEVKGGGGRFMPLDKKAQGIQFSTASGTGTGYITGINSSTSAAIAKGRYHRNSFPGMEGNQGPYRLRGANNETFIIVMAGSERVFIDGRLLERGVDRDYIIDYNLAEITFTSNTPITGDRRIVAEFEYSDRNYTRYMLANTSSVSTERSDFFLNVYSEHDAGNQPLLQVLSEEEIALMAEIGDNTDRASVQKVDSVEFSNDMVLYERADTVINGETYTIYRHSVDPDKANFRPGFSFVGENKGNYNQVRTTANGRVFAWTAPVNGIPSGTHEPVTRLVAPKKHQAASIGGRSSLSDNTEASFELAISNFDKNTFSSVDNDDNNGLALRLAVDNRLPLGGTGHLLDSGIEYEYTGRQFIPTERFRAVEHERDWNLELAEDNSDEHIVSWHAGYIRGTEDFVRYRGEYLGLTGNYSGQRNMIEAATGAAGFDSRVTISYLNSDSDMLGTGFLRHRAEISRWLRYIRLGIRSEGEDNRIEAKDESLLSGSSFAYRQHEVFFENPDTLNFHFFGAYRERENKLPVASSLSRSSFAREFSTGFRSQVNPDRYFSGTVHYRRLKPAENINAAAQPENSLNGRTEARLGFLSGAVRTTGFYETGAGLEAKRDFMYIEVARGQGTHTWTDYNENGIKEIDEFEPAVFADQADHIRIMIPTDDYIRTRSSQFSQTVHITPPPGWRSDGTLKRAISYFSGRSAYQASQKTRQNDLTAGTNPFSISLADTNLVDLASSFRNTISFQSPDSRFVLEYLNQNNRSRNLLATGIDTRQQRSNALNGRFGPASSVTISSRLETGTKLYESEFFPGRNFDIKTLAGGMEVSFHPGFALQTSLYYNRELKENFPGREKSKQHNLGTEVSYIIASKGNIMVGADYFYIEYSSGANTSLAWEMLEGMKPGNNMTLMIQFQQNITGNLQMSLNYNGRVTADNKFIHAGGMQMRAYF